MAVTVVGVMFGSSRPPLISSPRRHTKAGFRVVAPYYGLF